MPENTVVKSSIIKTGRQLELYSIDFLFNPYKIIH